MSGNSNVERYKFRTEPSPQLLLYMIFTTMGLRAEKKSLQILLSNIQAGPGRKIKQEQEEISRNHVPSLFAVSVKSREKDLVHGCEKFLPALA